MGRWVWASLAGVAGSAAAALAGAGWLMALAVGVHTGMVGLLWLRACDLFDPVLNISVLYGLYSWSSAAFIVGDGGYRSDDPEVMTYIVTILLGQLGLLAGGAIVGRNDTADREPVRPFNDRRFLVLSFVAIIIATIVSSGGLRFGQGVLPYTEVAALMRLEARADSSSGVTAYLGELPFVFTVAACFVAIGAQRVSPVFRVLLWVLSAAFMLQSIRAGSKFEPLILLIGGFSTFHLSRRRVSPWLIAGLLLVTYPFAVMISHVRFTASIGEMWAEAGTAIAQESSILLPSRSGELVGPPLTLLQIIQSVREGGLGYSYGTTYADELATWIPRAIWPERPRPLPEQYMEIFHAARDSEGKGEGFFIATSGYWAFGPVGVFAEMLGFAAFLAWLRRAVAPLVRDPVVAGVYSIGWFWLTMMVVRTGVFGTLKAMLMWVGPLLILMWLSGRSASVKKSGVVAAAPSPPRRRLVGML